MTTHAVIITYLRDQTQPAVDAIGGFYRTCVLTGKALVRRPFHWREAIEQGWFITSVSLLPTLAVSIPLTVLIIFTLNILLAEFGAADISGAGAALGAVTQLGPLTTVLVLRALEPQRSAPTWVPAPSGKRSMRWRCWASTPSTGWWCLGSLPRPSSPHCSTAR
ncbi:integral membrane protein YrbE2a [Mycobacterium tuberculosis]|nr:integral membrane protein YrbE2a [Mycobacterium tuberculosis]